MVMFKIDKGGGRSKNRSLGRGREPPDAMSVCQADRSLPDLLGRPSLHYADQASAMHIRHKNHNFKKAVQ